ncbi:MAG: site-specific integrase [Saprospiraceae bacterium]|nr:site-specific integrase [Saprospiraceae bacterium]
MSHLKKIKYRLIYNRTKNLNKDGTALVQVYAYQNGKSKYFSTDVWVEPKYWDDSQKSISPAHPNSHILNNRIRDKKTALESYELKMLNRYGYFHIDRLVDHQKKKVSFQSFNKFYRIHLEEAPIRKGAKKNQRTTLNKLCAFRREIFFEDLTYNLITSFDKFLRQQGLGVNTINKHHRNLKKYIKIAIREDYLDINLDPYKKFKPSSEEPHRIFLTQEELNRIEQLEFTDSEKSLGRIRDFFLAACWTGLRFSDLNAITPKNIVHSQDGLTLSFIAQKTGKSLRLPLYLLFKPGLDGLSKPEILFRKYLLDRKDLPTGFKTMPLFGGITNQYLNRSLKILAKKAGIQKNLSSHAGRRTFATIMATKVEMPILQRLLQHSTLEMVKIYVRLSDKQIINELQKVSW